MYPNSISSNIVFFLYFLSICTAITKILDKIFRSSCSLDEVNLEFIDPTVEAEVRQNRTAWKSVMEELKLQMIFSPDSDGKPHVTYQQNISAFDIQAGVEKVATAKDMDFTDEELLTYATCVEEEHSSVSMQLSARNMVCCLYLKVCVL